MLEHGEPEARAFLAQLDAAQVTPWRCACGCASVEFRIVAEQSPTPRATSGMHILGDFLFGPDGAPAGIFIFAKSGVLNGIEVYGMAGDAPTALPHEAMLRPFSASRGH